MPITRRNVNNPVLALEQSSKSLNGGRDEEEDEEDDQFREIDHEKEDFFRQQRHMKRASFYNRRPSLLSDTHTTPAIDIEIVSDYGFKNKSKLTFTVKTVTSKIIDIIWRTKEKLGCDFNNIVSVDKRPGSKGLFLVFQDNWTLHMLLKNAGDENDFILMIQDQLRNRTSSIDMSGASLSRIPSLNGSPSPSPSPAPKSNDISSFFQQKVIKCDFKVAKQQELSYQLLTLFKYKEAFTKLEKVSQKLRLENLTYVITKWADFARTANLKLMVRDRRRVHIHTIANQDNDLQAWYHSMFHDEINLLRRPFWTRDSVLIRYGKAYEIVETGMTALEEAAVSHILCTPDTTYGEVAGHMFVMQGISSEDEYLLFQKLIQKGHHVIKLPRLGRPAKRLIRMSFVDGHIYFTWKGRQGNQGVDLAQVKEVAEGITTDIAKRSGQTSKSNLYLSLICSHRSVDLCFESPEEKARWKTMLSILIDKEHGILHNIRDTLPHEPGGFDEFKHSDIDNDLKWFALYGGIGSSMINPTIQSYLMELKTVSST